MHGNIFSDSPRDFRYFPCMQLQELDFYFPMELVATEPQGTFRALWMDSEEGPQEINSKRDLFYRMRPGDLLVINNTRVLKRRVYSLEGFEILFLNQLSDLRWQVLYPYRKSKGQELTLPGGVTLTPERGGRPQVVRLGERISEDYFYQWGELALPPYIQKARGERKNQAYEADWYQTDWAEVPGSYAAPTASLHFNQQDLQLLKDKGVQVAELTLHVGLGTFLPIAVEDLNQHVMHSESVWIPKESLSKIKKVKESDQGRVWALGTTATRSLEAWSRGDLQITSEGDAIGETDIFIRPGYEFQVVDVLMTNFHQPKSTLLALVGAFAGLENVKRGYQWAIERKFRLFSYGDLSVWEKVK